MKPFYDIAIKSFTAIAGMTKHFSPKLKLLVEGREGLFENLQNFAADHKYVAWFHVASLGEYEQAKPVISKLKEKIPEISITITFFSPSGYENVIKKSQPHVDFISYIPFDTPQNAEKFISILNPYVTFFVKYDLWTNFIFEAKKKKIPLFLFSAAFRPEQIYFKSYGGFFRKILKSFDYIFTQNQTSLDLLTTIRFSSASRTGDTRFDNVNALSKSPKTFPDIEKWIDGKKVIVVGSAWQEDMDLLIPLINSSEDYIYIIAPHDIDIKRINQWQSEISKKSSLYSELKLQDKSEVLFIDNIGMLSSLYQYAEIAYVGGAFGKGLHNILEPMAYYIPVIFGNLKKTNKFPEAGISQNYGCGYSVSHTDELIEIIKLLEDKNQYKKASEAAKNMVRDNLGSAEKIIKQVMIHLGK
ncbi:MAG TPA: glycosyltransferase N-terminal domain-containing protein [Anditalea sp.]|nr:glycosyltransferase N-terminal domain-containing protein [Anditalea sp.]